MPHPDPYGDVPDESAIGPTAPSGVSSANGVFDLIERDERGNPIGMKMIDPRDVIIVRSTADGHVVSYLIREDTGP